jgi:hypothetical protein
MADDLNFQNISTVQNQLQPGPGTIIAASTIAPTTFLSFISGTTAIATITPPVTGTHMLALVAGSSNWAGAVTTGNILVASVTNGVNWLNRVSLFVYNPITAKYYPCYAVIA